MKRIHTALALALGLAAAGPALAWHDDYYSDGPRYRSYRSYRRAGWYDPTVSVYVGPRYRSYRSDWWW